jgi:hypothetical protein
MEEYLETPSSRAVNYNCWQSEADFSRKKADKKNQRSVLNLSAR